jgi:hypothetical protein
MNRLARFLPCCLLLFLAASNQAGQNPDRVSLFPKLALGQIIRYQVGYRAETHTTTESNVVAPMAPTGGQIDALLHLQVQVEDLRLEAAKPVVRLQTTIEEPALTKPATAAPEKGETDKSNASAPRSKTVAFTLHADGQVTDLDGLDRLSADEQAAWQEWVARFAAGGVFPERGVKPGDKWKIDEPISNALLAGLSWEKESEYVNEAPCGAITLTPQGDIAATPEAQETCAVILTTATLKQKSSPKDATPEDYKLHDLRTTGIATGKNQIISYISLKTGLVVRATEDANQSMDVVVAKTDGSNRVHYTIEAESHARVMLLAKTSAN